MHPTNCSSVTLVFVLEPTIFSNLNSCSWLRLLTNTDGINRTCFLISGNYFFIIQVDTLHDPCRVRLADSRLTTSALNRHLVGLFGPGSGIAWPSPTSRLHVSCSSSGCVQLHCRRQGTPSLV
jgi:hypothetical protein